jgi:hypothetical protein
MIFMQPILCLCSLKLYQNSDRVGDVSVSFVARPFRCATNRSRCRGERHLTKGFIWWKTTEVEEQRICTYIYMVYAQLTTFTIAGDSRRIEAMSSHLRGTNHIPLALHRPPCRNADP